MRVGNRAVKSGAGFQLALEVANQQGAPLIHQAVVEGLRCKPPELVEKDLRDIRCALVLGLRAGD